MQKKMLVNTIQSDMAPCNCFRNAFHFVEGPSLSQSEFVPIGLGMLFAINYLFNEQQTMQARDLTVIGTEKKTMARIQKQGFWGGEFSDKSVWNPETIPCFHLQSDFLDFIYRSTL